jgi:hypothetical protein
MQNIHLRDISNPFLYPDGEQTDASGIIIAQPICYDFYGHFNILSSVQSSSQVSIVLQVPGPHAYGSKAAQTSQPSRIPELPASTVVPTSTVGLPPTYDGV